MERFLNFMAEARYGIISNLKYNEIRFGTLVDFFGIQ